jgi:hypothetical protein
MRKSDISAEKLDSVFDKALVVMSILAAAELAYLLTEPAQTNHNLQMLLDKFKIFTLIETTVPFLIMVSLFMIKQLFANTGYNRKNIALTLISWDFWAWSMWTILYIFVGILIASLGASFYYTIIFAVATWAIFLLFNFKISEAYCNCFDFYFYPNSEKYLRKKYWWTAYGSMFLSMSIYAILALLALAVFI